MNIPKLIKVKQVFKDEHISDIEGVVRSQIINSGIYIRQGSSIAIAVGSRGIANIDRIVRTTVQVIKEMGAIPFIIPAMGSHGGADAEGQKQVLESYGITEEKTGAPIKSSMAVVELPQEELPNKVYMDKFAYEADGTIIINRIKVHTDFHGAYESGLVKMCVIGLGKHKQAQAIHRYGVYGLKHMILPTARQVLKHGNVILGIGIVENAYDQTSHIKAMRPLEIEQEEAELLELNRENMPSLPVKKIDILIVDEMGKDYSGTGLDTNIIGRMKIKSEEEPCTPDITNIVVSDLSAASHGNALGMGLADFITKKLYNKIDFKVTYENVLTSTFTERGKMPIVAENDKAALDYAVWTSGSIDIEKLRIVRIKNTLHLNEVYVSPAVAAEMKKNFTFETVGDYKDIFDADGNLLAF